MHEKLQPQRFRLPQHDPLPLIAALERKAVHAPEQREGIVQIAGHGDAAGKAEPRDLRLEVLPLRSVADERQMHVRPRGTDLGKVVEQQVEALLVHEPAHGAEIVFRPVDRELRLLPRFTEDLRRVDVVRDHRDGGVMKSRHAAKTVHNPRRYGGKGVEVPELALEEMPEQPVFRLLGVFDAHVVVDPHDALFRADRQRAGRALGAVAVEVHRHVVFSVRPDRREKTPCKIEVYEAARVGPGPAHDQAQVFPRRELVKGPVVKDVDVYGIAAAVQVFQNVHQGLLDAAHLKVPLKNGDMLHDFTETPSRPRRRSRDV